MRYNTVYILRHVFTGDSRMVLITSEIPGISDEVIRDIKNPGELTHEQGSLDSFGRS